jgi:hypothetical protein
MSTLDKTVEYDKRDLQEKLLKVLHKIVGKNTATCLSMGFLCQHTRLDY